jgi:hypothetical protein
METYPATDETVAVPPDIVVQVASTADTPTATAKAKRRRKLQVTQESC